MTPTQRFTLTHRQLGAIISRLNRSRAGNTSTGSFLENMSKLLQVLAIVVGGAWVLIDYFEFKKTNNILTNSQLKLANTTAELTQSSITLNNQLGEIKLARTKEGRLDVASESSVVRSAILPDRTFLYRVQVGVRAKNISDGRVFIPAMVIEFFIGTNTIQDLKPGQAFLINQPSSWLDKAQPGSIRWSRLTALVQEDPRQIHDELAKDEDNKNKYLGAGSELGEFIQNRGGVASDLAKAIESFTPITGNFVGVIPRGGSSHWNADFALRARPENMAGAVITFWERGENYQYMTFTDSRTELLSEAEDASSVKAQDQHIQAKVQ